MSGSIVLEAIWKVPLAAPARALRRQAVREVTDATFEDEVLAAGGADDRRLLGAVVQAVPGDRADPRRRSPPSTRLGLVRLNIDEHLGVPSRYGVLSLPTVILFAGGEPRATVVGARPRSHFERAFGDWLGAAEADPRVERTDRAGRRAG